MRPSTLYQAMFFVLAYSADDSNAVTFYDANIGLLSREHKVFFFSDDES